MSDSEETYEIEKVLDRKSTAEGVKYLIKWEGYSDDNNNWWLRDELISDGFKDEITAFDKEADSSKNKKKKKETKKKTPKKKTAPKKTPAKSATKSRARSKTPTRTPLEDEEEEEEEKKEEEEEEEEEREEEQVALEEERAVEAYNEDGFTGGEVFVGSYLLYILLAVIGVVVIRSMLHQGKDQMDAKTEAGLVFVVTFLESLPSLLCFLASLMQAESTHFSNHALVVLLWTSLVGLTYSWNAGDAASLHIPNMFLILAIWQLMSVKTLHVSLDDETSPISLTTRPSADDQSKGGASSSSEGTVAFILSIAAYLGLGVVLHTHDKYSFDTKDDEFKSTVLLWLATCACARSLVNILVSLFRTAPSSYVWLEMVASMCGAIFVAILIKPALLDDLKETETFKLGVDASAVSAAIPRELISKMPSPVLVVPAKRLAHMCLLWTSSIALMLSTLFAH